MAISSMTSLVVCGMEDGTVVVWDLKTGNEKYYTILPQSAVVCTCWLLSGLHVVFNGCSGRCYEVTAEAQIQFV